MLLMLAVVFAWLQPQERVIIVADANAREKPATESRVICRLGMGEEHQVRARQGDWVNIESCDGAFVHAPLTRAVTTESRARVREEILRERLARTGEGFAAADALLRVVDGWSHGAADREAKARYALYELQALARAADAAEQNGGFRSRFAHRLGEQSTMFFYNEVGGGWMLRNDYVRGVHDEYRGTDAADDIAWFAATNGLGGECEGYIPCYASWMDRLQGEYLRLYPRGRHAGAAIERILEVTGFFGSPPDIMATASSKAEACADLKTPLASLRAAVAGAQTARTAAALSALDRVAAVCR
jgi:hypothetical protein